MPRGLCVVDALCVCVCVMCDRARGSMCCVATAAADLSRAWVCLDAVFVYSSWVRGNHFLLL